MKKKAFTLIEILISLFLISIILMVMFRFFSSSLRMEIKIEQAKKEIFSKNNLQLRLDTIFSKISNKTFSNSPIFYTENNKLFFVYDNEIDPNPKLSSDVFAILYLSKNQNLTLKIFPFEKEKTICRKEILKKNVDSLSFEFFTKKDGEVKKANSWSKKQLKLPVSIKINLDKNSFAFFIGNMRSSITYIDRE